LHHDQSIYEESKLLLLLAEDSEYAFQLIYDRYRNRIYQTAIRYLKSPVLAQETVQDVFLKLWLERRNLDVAQAVEAWLYTVARNAVLNRLKRIASEWKALHQLQQLSQNSTNTTGDRLEDAQYQRLLQQVLSELPPQQQMVFHLARQENLTYAEIGQRMGISALTVKTHMARALNHIRSRFPANGDSFLISLSFLPVLF
jgi:RNA polymerase sigma-70 factor (family 1)